jgi:hypothetical protein
MPDIPNFDEMTPAQVREWGTKLAQQASEWAQIKATLVVNCDPVRRLGRLGFEYEEHRSVLSNLVGILEGLADRCSPID